jgi:hypothetical protein
MADLHFTMYDWERVQRDTVAWWEGELERPLVYLTTTDRTESPPTHNYLTNYPMDMPAAEIVDLRAPAIEATHYYGDAFPQWWMNFGPGIMAGFLGSDVNSVSETVWFTPVDETPAEVLTFDFDPNNAWWQRVQAVTRAAVARWDGMLAVGHTDLGGNLDIIASFRDTQQLLFDVIDQPEQIDRLVARTTELWIRYYDAQEAVIHPPCRGTTCWAPIWSPGKTYMLQCDFSYMISPAMFERFVVPDLVTCCDYLDHGFYHLDGKGEIAHLDHLLSIERLRGIQWIPGDGQPAPHEWLPLLKRIRDGGKLCQLFVTPEGARTIVQNLGGRGFLFVIQQAADESLDPAQAQAFLKTLEEEDISE